MIYLKKLNYLIKEFHTLNKEFETVAFFRQSIHYYLFWIEMLRGFYEKKTRSVEQLVFYMKHYGISKQTVLNLIKKAEKLSYLKKIKGTKDKRKTFIEPELLTIKQFEQWSKQLAKGLNPANK